MKKTELRNIIREELQNLYEEEKTENMRKLDKLRSVIEKWVLNPESGLDYRDIDKRLYYKYKIELNRPELSYLYKMVDGMLSKHPYNNKKYKPKKVKTQWVDENGVQLSVGDRIKGLHGEGQIVMRNSPGLYYVRYDKYDNQYEASYPIGYWDKALRDWAKSIEKI